MHLYTAVSHSIKINLDFFTMDNTVTCTHTYALMLIFIEIHTAAAHVPIIL